jgi:hypothetical protein
MDMRDGRAGLGALHNLLGKLFGVVGNGGGLIFLGAGAAQADLDDYFVGFSHDIIFLSYDRLIEWIGQKARGY